MEQDLKSSQTIANAPVVGSRFLSDKREIKFRGKSTVDGKWVFGYYIKRHGINGILAPNGTVPVHPWSVGQMLVKYDSKEFFENDIVKDWSGTRELKFEIFDDQQGCFLELDDTDLCVLGNVFDNPELLEGVK
jgi:hypothetical protein